MSNSYVRQAYILSDGDGKAVETFKQGAIRRDANRHTNELPTSAQCPEIDSLEAVCKIIIDGQIARNTGKQTAVNDTRV
jgi:hypothetical protein